MMIRLLIITKLVLLFTVLLLLQYPEQSSCEEKVEQGAANKEACSTCSATNGSDNDNETCLVSQEEDDGVVTPVVHQLQLDNFASVIGSSSFTLVLFSDPHDDSLKTMRQRRILLDLATANQDEDYTISFAELDIRRHAHLRTLYSRGGIIDSSAGLGRAYSAFHTDYFSLQTWAEIPPQMVNSSTFMMNNNRLPVMPSQWVLFEGKDYNVVDMLVNNNGNSKNINKIQDDHDHDSLKRWMGKAIQAHQGVATTSKKKPPVIRSQTVRARERRLQYQQTNPMKSINWDVVDASSRRPNNANADGFVFNPKLFQVASSSGGKKDGEETFFKYTFQEDVNQADAEIMHRLSQIIDSYLAWVEGYETTWDEERKAREDQQTSFGKHLKVLNRQIKSILLMDEASHGDIFPKIPPLKQYFQELVFGYGRFPSSLSTYLETNVYSKNNNNDTASSDNSIALFERIREYMRVRETVVGDNKNMYSLYFQIVWMRLYNAMAEFHTNLSRDYMTYLKQHPDAVKDDDRRRRQFQPMDVIDMKDPDNFALLSDYDEFERAYVMQGKPFVLANVGMTEPFNYTSDFLVEQCGFADVTQQVRMSVNLGDNSVQGWGGLQRITLPQSFMTDLRKQSDGRWDQRLSLEQFVALSQKLGNLYLFDYFDFKYECFHLFSESTPYDPPEKQYFRLPSVIGRYDLVHKLPWHKIMNDFPSLFIGRKGTNTKLHIDSGATGFWMYLVSGKKRWTVYDRLERPFLYERLDQPFFIADVLALNSTSDKRNRATIENYFDATYPLLSRATAESGGYEIIQQADQLVYIPPNTPHAVENLEDVVGVSFNQIPRAGVANHLHDQIHRTRSFGTLELTLRYLMTGEGRSTLAETANPLYTTLGEYLSQA